MKFDGLHGPAPQHPTYLTNSTDDADPSKFNTETQMTQVHHLVTR